MYQIETDASHRLTRCRVIPKMLALAIILTISTGFDTSKALPPASQADASATLQPASLADAAATLQPTSQADTAATLRHPLPADTSTTKAHAFNWRRDGNVNPLLIAAVQPKPAPSEFRVAPEPVHNWETGEGKSYLIPAIEIPAFLILLNIHDRFAFREERSEDGQRVYSSNLSTTWEHLKRQNWKHDRDPFNVNQFGHPYQGATMYGVARSTGLSFWESAVYSNVGSFLWEMAGETGHPSVNDMATTGTSGSLLGEALFRMSALVLKDTGGKPDLWHELGAAVLSPTTAFNRFAFGDRFKTVYPGNAPATFWRFRFGATLSGSSEQVATADFNIAYGLPGKIGYSYKRPLDYFDFQITGLSSSGNPLSSVLLRGLLYGKPYQMGDDHRGIWGLYGSYDYISPGAFRVSNTALSLGTTGQYWVAPGVALQGSLLGGAGFGAAGVSPTVEGERDYHYGLTPQGIMALRLLFGDRAVIELVGRGYYVSGTGSDDSDGSERLTRAVANLNVRVTGRHGMGLQFVRSTRDAHYGQLPSRQTRDNTLSLVYTFLGDTRFGAVEWRNIGDR